jgi:phosphatidylserine/phosphatidylglycerophosphate/cardiolipin synthase-like enzyme
MPSTTNPQDWFLNDTPYTDYNQVTPLIDGAAYFSELKSTMEALTTSPYLLISGWRLNPNTLIDPARGQSIRNLIESAIANTGLDVHSMLWYVPGSIGDFGAGHGPENIAFTDFILDQGGEAILDNRLPQGHFASHHQKYMVLGSDNGHFAFVGGIDIAPDRWDDSQHNNSSLREPELFNGWHDVQAKVEGPAVMELWSSFQERWNDPRAPHGFPTVGGDTPRLLGDSRRPHVNVAGTHSVQVLKTYACKCNGGGDSEGEYPFAPGGLFTYERGLVLAIQNAEHFIYIEDQYFWPGAVVDSLAEAVDRGVTVILILTRDYDVEGLVPYHNFLRQSAIEQLHNAERHGKSVFVFHLEQSQVDPRTNRREQIYVHSKTMIIDDRYMVIGSANLNRRSISTDTEIGIAVVDTNAVASEINNQPESVSELVRAYRKALWSEHLQANVQDDPFNGTRQPAGFPTGNRLIGHVRPHEVHQPRFCQPNIIPFGFMNTRTTCS